MSSIKLPHTSGNSMSIAAPTTNPASDLTLNLPATVGTAGQVLQNSSTPGALEFGAGGILKKLAYDSDTTAIDISSHTNWTDTGLSIAYTPISASSTIKIYTILQLYADGNTSNHGQIGAKLQKDGSDIGEELVAATGYGGTEAVINGHFPIIHFEAASNTNARTYKVQVRNKEGTASSAAYNLYSGVSYLIIEEYDLS